MFEFFRSHQKMMQFVLLLLIIPSFALIGLDSYSTFRDRGEPYAEVDGKKITPEAFEFNKRQQIERLRQQLGNAFDPTLLDSPQLNQAVLDDLLEDEVTQWTIRKEYLSASDGRLADVISKIQAVQENGRFSLSKYNALLAAQGRTPEMFEAGLRSDLAKQQVTGPVAISEFLPVTVKARLLEINDAPRVVQFLEFSSGQFAAAAKVSDAQISQYYADNQAAFKTPEVAEIEYAVLSPEIVGQTITISDADAKGYYEQNKTRFSTPEERKARHILIAADKEASSADKAKAKEKAEAILAKLKADSKQFAALAKAESQDPGSAAQGGDLGQFGRGMMVKEFESVAFALKKDEVSGVVATDFGFHIIEVTDIVPSVVKPFEQIKPEIVEEIRRQQVQSKFAEAAEAFTNLAFDQPDSLKPVLDRFKLGVKKATVTSRQLLKPAEANNPLGNGEFIASLFTEDVLKKGNNTKAITVGGSVVTARVLKYNPVAVRGLESVSADIKQVLIRQEAGKLAVQAGEAALEKAKKGEPIEGLSAQTTIARSKPQGLNGKAVAQAMKLDVKNLPAFTGADLGEAGFVLVKVLSAPAYKTADAKDPQVASDPRMARWLDSASQSSGFAALAAIKAQSKAKTLKIFKAADNAG
jgi:peptidyl-prolyl cis-trans isomerase D